MRSRVSLEAGSLKIPQDKYDKKTLRVTGTIETNMKFMIHNCKQL